MTGPLGIMVGVWFATAGVDNAYGAEPVFVPDFTPGTGDDFAVTLMLQSTVTDRLLADGQIVLGNDVVARRVGAEAVTRCADRAACPGDLLPQLPARIAVVAKVDRVEGTLVSHVYVYEAGVAGPVDSLYVPIAPGNEHLFANEVSQAVQAVTGRIGAPDPALLTAAAALIAGQPVMTSGPATTPTTPPPGTGTPPGPVTPVVTPPTGPAAVKRYDGSQPHTEAIGTILEGTGVEPRHLLGSTGAFRKSGLDPRDWLYRTMPHAGRVAFEIRGGIGLGDIDRIGDIRVEQVGGVQTNAYYQEGPLPGRNVRGDLYIGYAPVTMLDLGMLVGLQYGGRQLSTQVVRVTPGATPAAPAVVANAGQAPDRYVLDAINLYLQPRVRAYLVPLGPAKPFLFTGVDLRVFDRYQIDQPANIVYPSPPGGLIPGWVGGGGMMIDPGPIVGFFAEGMYIRHFGPLSGVRTLSTDGPWTHEIDPLADTLQITVGVTGGVQFRL